MTSVRFIERDDGIWTSWEGTLEDCLQIAERGIEAIKEHIKQQEAK